MLPDLSNPLDRFVFDHPLSFKAIRRAQALGIAPHALFAAAAWGRIGAARVALSRDGKAWEPEGPDWRLIIAARNEYGTTIDLIAVAPHAPDEVARLTGEAALLGAELLDEAPRALLAERGPMRFAIAADPLDWLAREMRALCVIDWKGAIGALRGLGEDCTMICPPAWGERLRARLAYGGLPRVRERSPAQERAAGQDRQERGEAA